MSLSPTFRRLAVATALAGAAIVSGPALAFQALALKVLGFSPDGRYFGFIHYGGQGDGGEYLAEVFVVDATRDRFAPGAPLRVDTTKEEGLGDKIAEPADILPIAEQRAAALIKRYGVTRAGALLFRDPEAYVEEPTGGSGGPTAGVRSASAEHARLGRLDLNLTIKEFDWPATSKMWDHPSAATCREELDWSKGAGFQLTLDVRGQTLVLNDDRTIPASRHCVLNYGIAEVHAYDRADGRVTIAVMLGMEVRGFEGSDRLFLAVTRIVGP